MQQSTSGSKFVQSKSMHRFGGVNSKKEQSQVLLSISQAVLSSGVNNSISHFPGPLLL